MTKEEYIAWLKESTKDYNFLCQPSEDYWCEVDCMLDDWDNYSPGHKKDYLDALEDAYFAIIELENK